MPFFLAMSAQYYEGCYEKTVADEKTDYRLNQSQQGHRPGANDTVTSIGQFTP
jgi:hypothetical protein